MSAAGPDGAHSPSFVPRNILVFRALHVGDMLCAVPALRALRATFPKARIVLAGLPWAAEFSRRFAAYIDEFLSFPGHPELPEQAADQAAFDAFVRVVDTLKIDLALQMHGNGSASNAIVARFGVLQMAGFAPVGPPRRDRFLPYPQQGHELQRLLSLAALVGARSQDESLEFPLADEDHAELQRQNFMAQRSARDYVCVHAGARDRGKCWSTEHFASVADQLATEFGLDVLLTGSASEHALAAAVAAQMRRPAINAACDMSLGAMAALIAGARLLICNDTAVSHIAAALRVPSVIVFVRSERERWAPLDDTLHRCVQDGRGQRQPQVLAEARALLMRQAAHAPARARPPR